MKNEQFLLSPTTTYFPYLISNAEWGGADKSRNSDDFTSVAATLPSVWVYEGIFLFALILPFTQPPSDRAVGYVLAATAANLSCCSCTQDKGKARTSVTTISAPCYLWL